jgi:PPM family protein phosphatase
MPLRRGAATDVGRMRDGNEDSYLSEGPVAAVADGMGGHRAGEVASATAMEALKELAAGGPWGNEGAATRALKDVVVQANRRIYEMAAKDSSRAGMGTTLTALLEDGDTIHLAHVGDSRAYLLRDGELSQLTVDHTLVQRMRDEGRLTQEEAERHPQRSIITRALGIDPEVEIDLSTFKILPGDRILLCSDGLSGPVSDEKIRNVLLRVRDPQAAADRLIQLANEAGGPDNITAVVLDHGSPPARAGEATGELSAGERTGQLAAVAPGGQIPASLRRAGRAGGRRRRLPGRGRERAWRRRLLVPLLVLLVLLVAGGWFARSWALRQYFVSFDGDTVAIFRGVPNLAGLRIAKLKQRTGITRSDVAAGEASQLADGVRAKSLADAQRIASCAPAVFSLNGCPLGPGGTTTGTTTAPTRTTRAATATTARATHTTKAAGG